MSFVTYTQISLSNTVSLAALKIYLADSITYLCLITYI